jgi:DMSO/TMAO reductase YedYZ molybdopterin-dependent catalytic subunit
MAELTMPLERRRAVPIPGGFGAGVGAALVMMLVMAVLRLTTNTPSIPELMEESLIRLTGGRVEAFFINRLGVGGKALLLVTIVEGTLLLGGLLGLLFARVWPIHRDTGGWRWWSGLLYGLVLGAILSVVFLPLVGQGLFGSLAPNLTAPSNIAQALYGSTLAPIGIPVWLEMFLLSVIFGLALVALLPWRRYVSVQTGVEPIAEEAPSPQRRQFLRAAAGGAVAVAGGAVLWGAIRAALAPPPVTGPQPINEGTSTTPEPATPPAANVTQPPAAAATAVFQNVSPVLVPEVTPVDSFYITTKNFIDPTVDGNSWKLVFKGMVDNPYSLTLKDLQVLPVAEREETLSCISNPIGGDLIGNAKWKGVDFASLLSKAKPQQGVVDVIVRAADGYSDSFPIDVALNNECVLAYEMNGQPLVTKHGYPARLLVPGIYGMKNCKWITEVELVNVDYKGYWEAQGWSDTAIYQTLSRIDYPNEGQIPAKPIYIGGIAWAGDRGIKRVEVSTDGGKSWGDAQVRPPADKYTWVLWTYPWAPAKGAYTIVARATDGKGVVQPARETDTYPDGATGYHSRQVRVD